MEFTPLNALETSLWQFHRRLLARSRLLAELYAAEIFCIRYGDAPDANNNSPNRPLAFIVQDGIACIPVFSSRIRLEEFSQGRSGHYALPAREFLRLTRGADLCLNPGSITCLLLSAYEIGLTLDAEP